MSGERILVVEDDLETMKMLMFQLLYVLELSGDQVSGENNGYQFEFTNGPITALRLLETGNFDALITDVYMQPISGLKLVEKARNILNNPLFPVVFLTAGISHEINRFMDTHEAVAKFSKPVREAALLQTLRELLDKYN